MKRHENPPVPQRTRDEIVRLTKAGCTRVEVAKRLGVSESTAYKYARLAGLKGRIEPKPKPVEPRPYRGAAYNARWGYLPGGWR